MSLLGNGTLANADRPYYGGGGGGGGGASTITNTLAVDTITPNAPATAVQFEGTVNMDNSLVYVSSLTTANTGGLLDVQGGLSFSLGGALVGVSSINGAAPLAAPIEVPTTSGGWCASTVALNPGGPVTVANGKWYMASVEISDFAFNPSTPALTDCFTIAVGSAADEAYLGTFNMAQLSTNRGASGTRGFSVSGPVESLSTAMDFLYIAPPGAASTFIITGGSGWLVPLN